MLLLYYSIQYSARDSVGSVSLRVFFKEILHYTYSIVLFRPRFFNHSWVHTSTFVFLFLMVGTFQNMDALHCLLYLNADTLCYPSCVEKAGGHAYQKTIRPCVICQK